MSDTIYTNAEIKRNSALVGLMFYSYIQINPAITKQSAIRLISELPKIIKENIKCHLKMTLDIIKNMVLFKM